MTNLTLPSRAVVRLYNKRGTAEQWIKEGQQAVKMTRLSCHRFRSNEGRVWLTIRLRHLRNRFRYPPGMERCLEKLVLKAGATGFQDPEKGGWEPVGPSGRKTVPGGLDWRQPDVYSQPPEGQKVNSG